MKFHLLIILGAVLLLTACSDTDYKRQLEQFEEMNRTDIPLSPDSVLPLVRHYDHWWHSRNHRMRAYYMLVCPTDQWEVYARAFMGYVQNNGNKFDSNFYLDAGVRYIHQRFEVELIGKNLTNQHDYTQRRFATLDRFTYLYHLRPVEVLLTFRFKF